MIYNYEAEILRYIHGCFNAIKLATYASDEDLFQGMSSIKEFPSFYYSRTNMNIIWDKPIKMVEGAVGGSGSVSNEMYPYRQEYMGTIIVENQSTAFEMLTKLKYYWNHTPWIGVKVPGINDTSATTDVTRVSLKLLSMSVEDVRLPNDKNGSCRALRFRWESNLLFNNTVVNPDGGLVKTVKIGYILREMYDPEHPERYDGLVVVGEPLPQPEGENES